MSGPALDEANAFVLFLAERLSPSDRLALVVCGADRAFHVAKSARHTKDRIGVFPPSSQFLEDLGRRENHQLDGSPPGFLGNVLHHGSAPEAPLPNDQTPTRPRDVLGQGQRGMAVPRPKGLRESLPALPDPSPIDH